MYQYILVCTITNIFLRILFCVIILLETVLCFCYMYAVVLQHWISAPICVQYVWLCSGTYSVHTSMYFDVSYIIGTYQYVLVQTKYIPKTLFLITITDVCNVCVDDVPCTDGYIHFMKCTESTTDIAELCKYTDKSFQLHLFSSPQPLTRPLAFCSSPSLRPSSRPA